MGSIESTKIGEIETRLFINGKFVESSDKRTFDLTSPVTNEKFAKVYEASEDDTNAAVAAAKAAFPAWSALSPPQRGAYFKKLASLILESHDELAQLEAMSMGRPVSGYFDSYAAASTFDFFAENGYQALGASSLNTPGYVNMTVRQPFGVVAAIIPWNVPILFLAGKSAPALIAGNTVVIKSSEKAPLTSTKVATLVEKAGFPPGVINIISGHGQISGNVLSHHMDVRVLSFTGSGRTGRLIQAASAESNMKNVILELGGKSPAIIFPDADIEHAVEETKHSIQWNSGQVCMANSRIYVHESIASNFIELFNKRFADVAIGDPLLPDSNHGPQADEVQFKQVQAYIESGKKAGKMSLGAETIDQQGFFIRPTVFLDTKEDAKVMKEEIFGPVVNINTFQDEDDVVAKANDTDFGLYAAVYTKDIHRALRIAKKLESGTVGVNCTSPTSAHDMPFGGYKSSGLGREGWTVSLNNFLETKTILMKVNDA
ncbi:Aldehyde dehydrogenase N-terminal [Penicillium concentricum]|uniref:aldehyde dehydrogenase (NAD(+)) n=1 Tax=Penicillium concentricum TaxID=293559 RepID=A0A9W9S6G6_9EURO|nr:Aldehyde dehydrogenase N-terminal [Penicillium concentricum]KAJ5371834.1 Aldehyde dehydrogenase N-terminal [Penicillium concentricum]